MLRTFRLLRFCVSIPPLASATICSHWPIFKCAVPSILMLTTTNYVRGHISFRISKTSKLRYYSRGGKSFGHHQPHRRFPSEWRKEEIYIPNIMLFFFFFCFCICKTNQSGLLAVWLGLGLWLYGVCVAIRSSTSILCNVCASLGCGM